MVVVVVVRVVVGVGVVVEVVVGVRVVVVVGAGVAAHHVPVLQPVQRQQAGGVPADVPLQLGGRPLHACELLLVSSAREPAPIFRLHAQGRPVQEAEELALGAAQEAASDPLRLDGADLRKRKGPPLHHGREQVVEMVPSRRRRSECA